MSRNQFKERCITEEQWAAIDALYAEFLPHVNIGASAIPAKGFAALNNFGIAVEEIRRASGEEG